VTRLSRRSFAFLALPLGVAGAAFGRATHAAGCAQPDSEALRASLNYVSVAPDPSTACAHCAFFAADAAGGACGACGILGGPVDATGHCESFSPPS
jgi:hypothetical protein